MALLTFTLGPDGSSDIITAVEKASAFQAASTKRYISGNGEATPVLGAVEAAWTARGSKKKVSTPEGGKRVLMPYTLAVIIPVHKDLLQDHAGLEKAIVAQGASALAKKFDETVIGDVAAPGSDFYTFGSPTTTYPVTNRATFIAALAAAADGGYRADSVVLSQKLYFELLAATNTAGAPLFDITDTTINGLAMYTFDSADSVGVVGAFKTQAVWGTVNDIEVKISEEATITTDEGVLSAFDSNFAFVRVEGRFGFQVATEDSFAVISGDAS